MNLRDSEQNLCSLKTLEDHIAGKGVTFMTHYNLVYKFIPMPQAMRISDAKAAVDKEWKKSRQFQHGIWKMSRARRSFLLEAQRGTKKVHFATLMDVSSQKMRS